MWKSNWKETDRREFNFLGLLFPKLRHQFGQLKRKTFAMKRRANYWTPFQLD
jgi:hypothetical protein